MSKFWKLGIVGWPLGYSLSPLMHTAALAAAGLAGEYKEHPVKPEALDRWLREEAPRLDGFNVTMPLKGAAYVWAQEKGRIEGAASSVAHAMRVINAVKMEEGIPVGFNTDGGGFLLPLRGMDLAGASVILLGAGGAARAILAVLAINTGVEKITIWNRSPANAGAAMRDLAGLSEFIDPKLVLEANHDLPSLPVEECGLFINATPMGQEGKEDVPAALLKRLGRRQIVYDLVYEPRETALIRSARAQGCRTVTGDEMLAGQGAAAFEFWTGVPAARVLPAMKKALDGHFAPGG
ncbi:MAG: shikimate dehydrogenase [Candidatus Omnitrophica bacterium]|nr:shikimate dehydrogenase [Candidatus Omnitrophota bacterium]